MCLRKEYDSLDKSVKIDDIYLIINVNNRTLVTFVKLRIPHYKKLMKGMQLKFTAIVSA